MLNIDQIKEIVVPVLKDAGVINSAIFGSYVRGEQREDSDIDLLIDVPRGTTLFDLVDLQSKLEQKLHRKVDLVTYRSIHPLLKDSILNNQIPIL
jgi:uncharacterized protein